MAPPVIDSVFPPGPITASPGAVILFTVSAHPVAEPGRSGTVTFNVVDAQGGNALPVTVEVTVPATAPGPLIYSAVTTIGVVTADPPGTGHFTLVV